MDDSSRTTGTGEEVPGARRATDDAVRWTASTRHMCVGTYVDESFARAVVQELDHERHRACAPSYGVDLRPVHHHARRALAAVRSRDLVTSGSWLVALILVPVAALAWTVTAKLSVLAGGGVRSLPGMHKLRQRPGGSEQVEEPSRELLNGILQTLLLAFVCTYAQTQFPFGVVSGLAPALLLVAVFLVGVPWWAAWRQQDEIWRTVSDELVPGASAPRPSSTVDLPRSAAGDEGNLVVYSGYRPFVGSGVETSSWALDLRLMPAPEAGPSATHSLFDTVTLINCLREDLGALSRALHGISGLTVVEKLYVDGRELDGPRPFGRATFRPASSGAGSAAGRGRPVDRLAPEIVAAARGRVDGPVRHCLCVQVKSWEADVMLTAHLQAVVVGETLHLSSTTAVLTPVREAYRQSDRLTERHRSEEGARVAVAALSALRESTGSPIARPLGHLLSPFIRERGERRRSEAIAHDRRYDFGARRSLRELAASGEYGNYFQRVDMLRVSRQIELRILSRLSTLLEEHGLDTSELRERRNVILNNGVLMTGGSMHGAVAAGTNAQATVANGAFPGAGGAGNTQPGGPSGSSTASS